MKRSTNEKGEFFFLPKKKTIKIFGKNRKNMNNQEIYDRIMSQMRRKKYTILACTPRNTDYRLILMVPSTFFMCSNMIVSDKFHIPIYTTHIQVKLPNKLYDMIRCSYAIINLHYLN